jgi:hypothetical protein
MAVNPWQTCFSLSHILIGDSIAINMSPPPLYVDCVLGTEWGEGTYILVYNLLGHKDPHPNPRKEP